MATLTIIVIAVAVSVITGVATFLGVRARSKSIIKEAEAEGEMIKKEKMLQAKEKFIQLKSEHDKQVNERNQRVAQNEQRVKQMEANLQSQQRELENRSRENARLKEQLEAQLQLIEHKKEEIDRVVEERLLDVLLPATRKSSGNQVESSAVENQATTREQFRQILRSGGFDGKVVDITVTPSAHVEIGYMQGGSSQEDLQEAMNSIGSLFQRPRTRRVSIKRAREIFTEEETGRVLDKDKVYDEAKTRTEQMGIIFLDEFDKIADTSNRNSSSVSREGVQRDILPIVEGTKVNTKWGVIDTTNILFIAAGAFSFAKPSDLIPELQGRFPIRVELSALGTEDFYRILTEPENALTKQYAALMATDGVTLDFTDEGLRRLAEVAYQVNSDTDNIGARRLHTVMEKLLEDVSYAPESHRDAPVVIDAAFVDERLNGIASSQDMSRYIL